MLDIKFLENSWYFKKIILEKWEVLFDEWEIDNNLYIIILWKLLVKKYTTSDKKETKVLAYLSKDDIFWEAALNDNNPKSVKISSHRKTYLLSINAKKWLDDFSQKYPLEWQNLLKYIIYLSNKRLNASNYLITANYKISDEIIKLNKISSKSLFDLIDKLKNVVMVDYILYFEKNPVMDNYLTLKYDTRLIWKMQDKIVEITNNKLDLLNFKVKNITNYTQELSIWENSFWYLIFFKKEGIFSENDKKVLISTSTSIAWVIKEKQLKDEQNNIDFMEE